MSNREKLILKWIGKRITLAYKQHALISTQEKLAEKMKCSRQKISNICRGTERGLTVSFLYSLCDVLNIKPSEILPSQPQNDELAIEEMTSINHDANPTTVKTQSLSKASNQMLVAFSVDNNEQNGGRSRFVCYQICTGIYANDVLPFKIFFYPPSQKLISNFDTKRAAMSASGTFSKFSDNDFFLTQFHYDSKHSQYGMLIIKNLENTNGEIAYMLLPTTSTGGNPYLSLRRIAVFTFDAYCSLLRYCRPETDVLVAMDLVNVTSKYSVNLKDIGKRKLQHILDPTE